ncbi:MAG: hypothetical protein A2046_01315 [Bacteroidetes bacterium GWA2_30_7]|nr:MAG: hypothetical protein A2046_01315 [Bacteroidetes bacterium GWA2_30_7]
MYYFYNKVIFSCVKLLKLNNPLKNISYKIFIIALITVSVTHSVIAQSQSVLKVYFAANKFDIDKNESAKISNFLDSIKIVKLSHIDIFGYCNDFDTEQHNLILSKNRSKSVKQKLIELKVDSTLISKIEGKGEIQPKDTNKINIKTQRIENRRVEITFYINDKEPEKIVEEIKPIEEKKIVKQLFSDSVKIGDKIVLDNILFYGNEHIFREQSYSALQNLLEVLKQKSQIEIKILGHVCCGYDDGTDNAYGTKNLSFTRAKAVYDYLIINGIDSTRLSYTGLAGRFPTGNGDTADKRVEIQVTGINK